MEGAARAASEDADPASCRRIHEGSVRADLWRAGRREARASTAARADARLPSGQRRERTRRAITGERVEDRGAGLGSETGLGEHAPGSGAERVDVCAVGRHDNTAGRRQARDRHARRPREGIRAAVAQAARRRQPAGAGIARHDGDPAAAAAGADGGRAQCQPRRRTRTARRARAPGPMGCRGRRRRCTRAARSRRPRMTRRRRAGRSTAPPPTPAGRGGEQPRQRRQGACAACP